MRGATSIIGNIPIALSRNNELHCITFIYLLSPTTDSLKNEHDYFLNV